MGTSVAVFAGSPDDEDEDQLLNMFFGGAVVLGVGTVTSLSGGIVWRNRVGRRNEIEAERDSLIEQRRGVAGAFSTLQIGSEYRDDTHFVKVGFRF